MEPGSVQENLERHATNLELQQAISPCCTSTVSTPCHTQRMLFDPHDPHKMTKSIKSVSPARLVCTCPGHKGWVGYKLNANVAPSWLRNLACTPVADGSRRQTTLVIMVETSRLEKSLGVCRPWYFTSLRSGKWCF